ncbi:gas vesicle protein GvpO [Xylanimonas sp. McL0601]|uniref:gas vesicle protein GvpO n=1 Tax=Xylanimonas sp. McL0601 TaxID=3414739 RepID=UPI003CF9C702
MTESETETETETSQDARPARRPAGERKVSRPPVRKAQPRQADPPEKKPEPTHAKPRLSAGEAARAALEQFGMLGRHHVESVVAVEHLDDGWSVVLEAVEDRHVPSTADIMAEYEVQLDEGGELMGFRRTRRYVRGRAGDHG